jgi:FkbM family methyltransferase
MPQTETKYSPDQLRAQLERWTWLDHPLLRNKLAEILSRLAATLALMPSEGTRILQIGDVPNLLTLLLSDLPSRELELVHHSPHGHQRAPILREYKLKEGLSGKQYAYWVMNTELTGLPYPDDSIDGVILEETLHRLCYDPVQAVAEMHRVLKPGGWLLLTTPNAASHLNIVDTWLARSVRSRCCFSLPGIRRILEAEHAFAVVSAEAKRLSDRNSSDIRYRSVRLLKAPWLHEEHLFVLARKARPHHLPPRAELLTCEPEMVTYLPSLLPLVFRSGTIDQDIFHQVAVNNEYRLPYRLTQDDVLIDIGAHIGAFAYAALQRGAGMVYAVEADRDNCRLAESNLQTFIEQERAKVIWGAVWRSDVNEYPLYHGGYSWKGGLANTGGGSVVWCREGEPVVTIPFDELMTEATQQGQRRIRLLKLDCEGSEWPILFTSQKLGLIDAICGEFHEISGQYDSNPDAPFQIGSYDRFTVVELERLLKGEGFRFAYERNRDESGAPTPYGLFFAQR